LIPRLETDTEDPLEVVRCQLESLYEDERKHSSDFPAALQAIEASYEETFGHRAEFWLLLAIGYRIVTPYPTYGNPSSSYYGRADRCDDVDTLTYLTLQRSYADYLIEQLEIRSKRSPALLNEARATEYSLAAIRLRFASEKQATTT
jgi:hypothetical protein